MEDSDRPAKRAKVTLLDSTETDATYNLPNEEYDDDDGDGDDAMPPPTEEIRASDLYLDTAS